MNCNIKKTIGMKNLKLTHVNCSNYNENKKQINNHSRVMSFIELLSGGRAISP